LIGLIRYILHAPTEIKTYVPITPAGIRMYV